MNLKEGDDIFVNFNIDGRSIPHQGIFIAVLDIPIEDNIKVKLVGEIYPRLVSMKQIKREI